MNKDTLKELKKEEEILSEIKDSRLEIQDLEAELTYQASLADASHKYISYLENRIEAIYNKIDRLDEAN